MTDTVTQTAREAALITGDDHSRAAIYDPLLAAELPNSTEYKALVFAFALHRLAAEQRGMERAAVALDELAERRIASKLPKFATDVVQICACTIRNAKERT